MNIEKEVRYTLMEYIKDMGSPNNVRAAQIAQSIDSHFDLTDSQYDEVLEEARKQLRVAQEGSMRVIFR